MWGSFEIKNTRLIQKLLQQYSRKPLPTGQPDAPALLHQLADRFSALPMYFMKFHGGSDLEDVLDAMEYAVYVSDVEHIILDNLQFMISRNSLNKSFDKFDIQDIAIEKFRKFATDRNVHVTLVSVCRYVPGLTVYKTFSGEDDRSIYEFLLESKTNTFVIPIPCRWCTLEKKMNHPN